MGFEFVLLALGLAASGVVWHACLIGRGAFVSRAMMWAGVVFVSVAVIAGAEIYRTARRQPTDRDVLDRPIRVTAPDYVTSDTCRSCHPLEYSTWHRSFHRTMTQVATQATVVAPFEGVTLEQYGIQFELEQRGDEFWVKSQDGRERRIVMTTGSHHMQAFWLASEVSRKIRLFDFCYRIHEKQWMPISCAFLVDPDRTQQTHGGRWNVSCSRCHATGVRPRLRSDTEMDTFVTEFGIACEACHGPAEDHVAAHASPLSRARTRREDAADPTIFNPRRADPRTSAEACGHCHGAMYCGEDDAALSHDDGCSFRPGDRLYQDHRMRTADPTQFWSDGTIRVNGREINGLYKSQCFVHGDPARPVITCISCHSLHPREDDPAFLERWADDQLKAEMATDLACTQCHCGLQRPSDLTAHTHHSAESSGSRCYNCHMPNTAYGLLKATRSHTIDIPSVDKDLEVGRPNACNLCHLDQTLQWTADRLADWYGRATQFRDGQGFSEDQRTVAAAILGVLQGDAGVRAIYAWSMGWEPARNAAGTSWMPAILAPLLNDPYHAVRFIAAVSLRKDPGFADFEYDSLASQQARKGAVERAWERSSTRAPSGDDLARLLIAPQGKLRKAQLRRLLSQRDERVIDLNE